MTEVAVVEEKRNMRPKSTCFPKGLRKSERSSVSAVKYSGSIGALPTLGGSRAEQHFHDPLRKQEYIFRDILVSSSSFTQVHTATCPKASAVHVDSLR